MEYQVTLKPWGNSQGIRIPKAILDMTHIKENDVLLIEADQEKIILKKAFRHKTFEERLADYDGEITICDFDWGDPKGRELI